MGHYDKQMEQHFQSLDEAIGTPHTKPTILCAPSGYVASEKPLKESEGKAHDARLCFLQDIAVTMTAGINKDTLENKRLRELGELLALIVRTLDKGWVEDSKHYCGEVLRSMTTMHDMNDLIGVRAQALASGKYSFESYREPIDVNLLLDAAARHFLKILFVGNNDEESGFPHTAHIAANVIMIHTQLDTYEQ